VGEPQELIEVSKPVRNDSAALVSANAEVAVIEHGLQHASVSSDTAHVKSEREHGIATAVEARQPRGRELRSLGDFQTYEAIRGKLYEIWRDQTFLGEVEVVKRATAAPKLYGDRVMTAQSEYEGRVDATDDCFRSFDLYAATREVARRAGVE